LRPSIRSNMKKESKNMYEEFWEAIRVECLIKRYRLRKAKMQDVNSLQTTEAHVVELNVENVKTDIEVQNQE
ncbi:hypothetical protein, partial [Corallococcus interemptor]|uniref:hypothetical protein n=1 Tax=Corallococcus interemptor TaxID=2316720 RepID=UPI001ABF8503